MLAGADGLQLVSHGFRPAGFTNVGAKNNQFVGQSAVVFLEGMLNDNPVEHSQSAKEQERRRRRKEEDELRCNRVRLSPV
jgi:hypothetical protein